MINNKEEIYYQTIKDLNLSKSISGLKYYLKYLFKHIDFKNKNILDIGAGSGLFSCYMGFNKAKKVIGLEPELGGSRRNYIKNFAKLTERLNLENVFLLPKAFQDFDEKNILFDIILLHHSINHLDEKACMNLKDSKEAYKKFKMIFKKLYSISKNNSQILIADCSNKNFFPLIGINNIFAPSIEWNKHQSPETWRDILLEAGFKDVAIRWVPPQKLKNFGKFLFANKIFSFFYNSHFIISAKK
jgi:SAM-dependent methyltransferase